MEGCPIFIPENKRDPILNCDVQEGYDMKYISPFEIFLENQGLLNLNHDSNNK